MDKFEKANGYLAAWIRSNGRFDLNDLADRAGVRKELDYIRNDLLEMLDDREIMAEAYEIYHDQQYVNKPGLISDWLKELTDRYFA